MSKFKIKLKLQGLELEVEGAKEDIPLIADNISAQFSGLLAPAANIAGGNDPAQTRELINVTPTNGATVKHRRKGGGGGKRAPASGSNGAGPETFEFVHDVGSWGSPKQEWNTANKSMWLLYVASKQNVSHEMSASQIAGTFNKLFRQANTITPTNVSRDLGKQKKAPAKVNEDTTKSPVRWFLTEEGIKHAESLVQEARGG